MSDVRVGVVVVAYGPCDRTLRCLESVLAAHWEGTLRTVLVDNGTEGALATEIDRRFPAVEYVDPGRNLGYGAACQRGIDHLDDVDFVALLNNDVEVHADWLAPLVETLLATGGGAASPRLLFADTSSSLRLEVPGPSASATDPRHLGVRIDGVLAGTRDVTRRVQARRGLWGWERGDGPEGFTWTAASADLEVPVAAGDRIAVRLAGARPTTTVVAELDGIPVRLDVGTTPAWFDVGPARPRRLIDNAGTALLPDGTTVDRQHLEPDVGEGGVREVFGWSAAAVLLSTTFLRDVGTFDDRYFLYYEDTDLAWRGRRRAWSAWYVPQAVAWHEHSATTRPESPLIQHLLRRNRILLLVKVGPPALALRAVASLVGDLRRTITHDVLSPAIRGRRPVWPHVVALARVAGAVLRAAPRTLWRRRVIRRTATATMHEVMSWSHRPDEPPTERWLEPG